MSAIFNPDFEHRVLIVDDDADLLDKVRLMLLTGGIKAIDTVNDSAGVLPHLAATQVSVLLLDWVMPGQGGADLLPQILLEYPGLPVIILTAVNEVQTAVECMHKGAFDFITKPVDPSRLISSIYKAFQINELNWQNKTLKECLLDEPPTRPEVFRDIVTASRKMEAIFRYIEALASSRNPVLITGESGVGKELLATAIHRASGLQGEFVALNVAGLDDLMLADALFGHRRGAFTGANEGRDGLLKKAEHGTIFLDEIGDLSLESQLKLLRMLQEKEYYRLGSDALTKTTARVIAATNRDFRKLIREGKFRHDLYHRLCGHEFTVPPLRERREDVPLLLRHFVDRGAARLNKTSPAIAPQLLETLENYDFPGNVRELENKTFNAVTTNSSGTLTMADFPGIKRLLAAGKQKASPPLRKGKAFQVSFARFPTLEAMEQHLIDAALSRARGNKSTAADLLGISRMTLSRKLISR
jgi:DNA-binding NtrC family response regulator